MSTTVDLGKITASVTVGTTTTGAAGTNASVSNSGTTQDAVLNFTIPRGAQGVQGVQGSTGPQGPAGPTGPQGPMGDVAVITPEQQAAFTMYSVPGQNTDGPMTQKAVTDALGNINIAASSVAYDNSQSGLAATDVQKALDETSVIIGVSERPSYSLFDNKFISPQGVITNGNGYEYTTPIFLCKGDKITVKTASYLLAIISLYDNGQYIPIYAPTEGDTTTLKTYEYTATDDCYVVASLKKSPAPSITIESDIIPINTAKGIFQTPRKIYTSDNVEDSIYELQDKIGDITGEDLAKNLTKNTGHYIDTSGIIHDQNGYFITSPCYIKAGTRIAVSYNGGGITVVAKVDNNTYTPILIDERTYIPDGLTKIVDIEEDGYFVFCSTIDYGIRVVEEVTVSEKFELLDRQVFGKIKNVAYEVWQNNKYIDSNLTVQDITSPYLITKPFDVEKGDRITVNTKGGLMYVLVEYSNDTITRGLLFSDYTSGSVYREYTYTADKSMSVLVGGMLDNTYPLTISIESDTLYKKVNRLTQYHCGIYLYPFRAIVGKPVSIYRESVISGLRPLYNYTVQTDFDLSDPTDDFTKFTIRFKPTAAGNTPLTIVATDEFNNKISKTVTVESKEMPLSKLSDVSSMDVMFLGDSMIGFNGNLIGGEWKRMLATNDSETYVDPVTKAVQLPTYNVCPGKLNLVGEQLGSVSGVRYCYVNRIQQILTGKRTTNYNPNIGDGMNGSMNPFYNKNSSNPDTVGEDGFNMRVDFDWYFDNACGVGKYPKLFYIALGANDIYQTWNWSFDGVQPTTELLLKVIKKIKSVCDARDNGESGIKIKVFNHQTYPLYNMYGYEFPILQQRLVWNALYDSYYEAITNPEYGVSGYTEFVDCGSKFDWRVGYTMEDIATNVRYDGNQDVYIEQTCHMNNVGAYNYADCLIDDFLADSDFD